MACFPTCKMASPSAKVCRSNFQRGCRRPLPARRAHRGQGVRAALCSLLSPSSRAHWPGPTNDGQCTCPLPPSHPAGEPWHGRALSPSPSGSLSGKGSARQALPGMFCHLAGTQGSVAFPWFRLSLPLSSMGPQMPWLWGLRQTRCPFQATKPHARRTVQHGPLLTQP